MAVMVTLETILHQEVIGIPMSLSSVSLSANLFIIMIDYQIMEKQT